MALNEFVTSYVADFFLYHRYFVVQKAWHFLYPS